MSGKEEKRREEKTVSEGVGGGREKRTLFRESICYLKKSPKSMVSSTVLTKDLTRSTCQGVPSYEPVPHHSVGMAPTEYYR